MFFVVFVNFTPFLTCMFTLSSAMGVPKYAMQHKNRAFCAMLLLLFYNLVWLVQSTHYTSNEQGEDGVDRPQQNRGDDGCGCDIAAEAFEDDGCPRASYGEFGSGNVRGDGDKQVIERQGDDCG